MTFVKSLAVAGAFAALARDSASTQFEEAVREGRELTFDEAVEYALAASDTRADSRLAGRSVRAISR